MEQSGHSEAQRRENADEAWWHLLGVLWRRRVFIVAVTLLVAIASVVLSLMMTNWYRSSSRLLLPTRGSGGLASAVMGDLSSALSFIGGGGGDYVRYLAILNSRTVMEATVDTFNLVEVYALEEEAFPIESAISMLGDNVDFAIDDEYEFLSVSASDTDPRRAAEMSNYLVRQLNRLDNQLASRTAGQFRRYVEERFDLSRRSRTALLDSLQTFQQRYGVIDLESQLLAYFNQLAEIRIAVLEAEIRYQALRSQFGDDNPEVQAVHGVVLAADDLFQKALEGGEQVLPVARDEAPVMIHRYAELTMERTIQEKILEVIAPMLEQARFEEQRDVEAVQVVDRAVPPTKKFKPRRSFIVIAATLSAFILSVLYALASNWWRTNSSYFFGRLDEAVKQSARIRN